MKKQPIRFIHDWLASWLDIICGLASILTFTLWDMGFRFWFAKKWLNRRIKGEQ